MTLCYYPSVADVVLIIVDVSARIETLAITQVLQELILILRLNSLELPLHFRLCIFHVVETLDVNFHLFAINVN